MYKVVCAWCGKYLNGSETADEVSHGICEACQVMVVSDHPVPGVDQCEGAACEQYECDRTERARPGTGDFISGPIASEAYAEASARGDPTIQAAAEVQNAGVVTKGLQGDVK